MPGFLRNFDRTSFWFGVLAGIIFWFLLNRLRPLFAIGLQKLKENFLNARRDLMQGTENRLASDTLHLAQASHLASPLFSLQEILVVPRLIAPPPPVFPGAPQAASDITEQVIPYLPDWPQLSVNYHGPSLGLAEALSGGVNAIIIGSPGSGKSAALAYLAAQVAQHDPECGALAHFVPVLIHAADLDLTASQAEAPVALLVNAVAGYASRLTIPRLPRLLESAFEDGRGLLLLDGLDEFSPAEFQEVTGYLRRLLERYPRLRLVTAASPHYFDGLVSLGCVPFALAPWNPQQVSAFIQKWGDLWEQTVAPPTGGSPSRVDPVLISGWLASDSTPLTPFELTLKVWAAYAGDATGGGGIDTLDAYIKRMTVRVPQAYPALERIAAELVLTLQPSAPWKDVEKWVQTFEPAESQPGAEIELDFDPTPRKKLARRERPAQPQIRGSKVLPGLLESGLLVSRPGDRLACSHPVITGFLAAGVFLEQELARPGSIQTLVNQPEWAGKATCLQFIAAASPVADWVPSLLNDHKNDILLEGLFSAARLLPAAPENASWRGAVMRELSNTLQNENLPLGLRARAMAALAVSGSSGVAQLFRQALLSADSSLRQLAALGCGQLRDPKASLELTRLLADFSPNVQRATCLALVAIGDKPSIDMVASALLNGDEALRRSAAEALANHVEEGHPILVEGSTMEDLQTRRAVIYGLARIRQPWAVDLLHKLQAEDQQWVVQTAATEQLELLSLPDAHIPLPLPELFETPWLIQFSGEQGMGLGPGKVAQEMLTRALKDGKPEQILAALYELGRRGDDIGLLPIYQLFFQSDDQIREAALNTLWHLKGAGCTLPAPLQFGLSQLS